MISPNNQGSLTEGFASNVIHIHGGREAAKMYPVQSGYAIFLLDEESNTFFIKINDANGIPRQLREFKYEEVTPVDSGTIDPSKFATKDDFNILLNEIKKLNNNHYRPRRNNYGSDEKSV